MIRLYIQVEDEQTVALRRMAREAGVSQAALVREALDGFLDRRLQSQEARLTRALSLVGRGSSGCPDLLRDLDRHFAEAVERADYRQEY